MSRDAEQKNMLLFDKRTVERNIRKGLVSRKDYEKFLKALPDAVEKTANAETVSPAPAPEAAPAPAPAPAAAAAPAPEAPQAPAPEPPASE